MTHEAAPTSARSALIGQCERSRRQRRGDVTADGSDKWKKKRLSVPDVQQSRGRIRHEHHQAISEVVSALTDLLYVFIS